MFRMCVAHSKCSLDVTVSIHFFPQEASLSKKIIKETYKYKVLCHDRSMNTGYGNPEDCLAQ